MQPTGYPQVPLRDVKPEVARSVKLMIVPAREAEPKARDPHL